MRPVPRSAAALALALFTQCRKADPDPASLLPPATQAGANTFGCLVNGQFWKPQGNDSTSNYSVYYDYGYAQGNLSVATYRITNNGRDEQVMGFGSDSLRTTGVYKLRTQGRHQAGFADLTTPCRYYSIDPDTYCQGILTITRLDRVTGIVAGTFAFTLAKPGCDTIKVTQRRFDKKL